jgi:cobalt-precorrin 5A hydrolase
MIAIGIGANSVANDGAFLVALAEAWREAGGADVIATFKSANFANRVEAAARQASIAYCPLALDAMRERNDECSTRSERTLTLFGVASIAETAALAAAGPGSRLVVPRRIIGNITVAAAQSADARGQSE